MLYEVITATQRFDERQELFFLLQPRNLARERKVVFLMCLFQLAQIAFFELLRQ